MLAGGASAFKKKRGSVGLFIDGVKGFYGERLNVRKYRDSYGLWPRVDTTGGISLGEERDNSSWKKRQRTAGR